MKKTLLTALTLLFSAVGLFSQNQTACNFDNISSNYYAWGNVSISATQTTGSFGLSGFVSVPAENQGDGIYFDLPAFSKASFTSIGLRIKCTDIADFAFAFKLENTLTGNVVQDWTTYPRYNGNGEWAEVFLNVEPLTAGTYNRIVLVPAPYEGKQAFSFYIDDVRLIARSFIETSNVSPVIKGNQFYVNDNPIFFNGINTAWQWNNDYRLDFLGRNYNEEWWKSEMDRYVANKINLARIWIHGGGNTSPSLNGDGLVTGATEQFWTDMDKLVALSKEKKVYIMPTFWSFDMVKNDAGSVYNSVNWEQYRQIINDENKSRWYCEYFLVPFVQRYENEPYVMGYDICNEPEHIWRDANCGNLSRDNVIRFMAICASYIHKNSTKPVTIGSMWIICNSDRYSGWTDQEQYAGNNYSDAALKAQYNDEKAYLDFYSPHWYQWQTSGSYFSHRVEQWLDNNDRPALIGETPGYDIYDNNWNISLANAYLKAYENGYAGVCAWKSPWENDGYGTFNGVINGTNAFYNHYPELVYPSLEISTPTNIQISQKEESTVLIKLQKNSLSIETNNNKEPITIKLFSSNGYLLHQEQMNKQGGVINLNSLQIKGFIIVQSTIGEKQLTRKLSVRD